MYEMSTSLDGVRLMDLVILRAANRARQVEWLKGREFPASLRGLELDGEAGEAANIVKKLERARLGFGGTRATVTDLAGELADTIIAADLVANHYDIDLRLALQAKFNETSLLNGFKTKLVLP